jgi:O-acetyl-ADP-ribose deacetylase (regulator of RNase III)
LAIACTPFQGPGGISQYTHIVHTVAPFWERVASDGGQRGSQLWENGLRNCYHASLSLASEQAEHTSVALPLLGAGARGAPLPAACRVAAEAVVQWSAALPPRPPVEVHFGVVAGEALDALQEALSLAVVQSPPASPTEAEDPARALS